MDQNDALKELDEIEQDRALMEAWDRKLKHIGDIREAVDELAVQFTMNIREQLAGTGNVEEALQHFKQSFITAMSHVHTALTKDALRPPVVTKASDTPKEKD